MTPKRAKEIASEYGDQLNFWYDRNLRLWTTSDPRCYGSTDYIAPGWLREYTEEQLRETFEFMAREYREINEFDQRTPAELYAIAGELNVPLTFNRGFWIVGHRQERVPGRQLLKLPEANLRHWLASLRFERCELCGEPITGRGEYKLMPSRGAKHPPLYSLCHPDCEVQS